MHGEQSTVPYTDPHGSSGAGMEVDIPSAPRQIVSDFYHIPTTVYVGHICTRIDDETVRELLDLCGNVIKWTRQPDPLTGMSYSSST
jgi:hypothetical protein